MLLGLHNDRDDILEAVMEKFDKKEIKDLRRIIQLNLAEIGQELGLEFNLKGITYTGTDFSARLECRIKGELTRSERTYVIMAEEYGLPPLGTRIRVPSGKTFTLSGWNTRAPKYPVEAQHSSSTWKLAISQVRGATILD